MSIGYTIPHSSFYHPTSNIFTAVFNNPTLGKYNFDNANNKNVPIIELTPGSVYLIERISLAGSIAQEAYLQSIETIPIIRLKRGKSQEIIYKRDIPIVNYIDNQEMVAWIYSQKSGDFLTADVYGILTQIAETIEVTEIKININLSIYQIRDQQFINKFLGAIGSEAGNQVTGR
jgi:hypothetical protein